MRIAIIGAGFSGLATCWHLLQYQSPVLPIEVVVFDPKGIGGGTSGIAAGLLHPYVGLNAKYNLNGNEGMAATRQLLDIASNVLQEPVASYEGILRLAVTDELHALYSESARLYPDVKWLTADECSRLMPFKSNFEGILIKSGITVYTNLYLQGLWKACEKAGATHQRVACQDLQELNDFDAIVVAAGASVKQFAELSHLALNSVKGQVLELAWPADLDPLSVPLNSMGYLVKTPFKNTCIAGSTYERNYSDASPNVEVALREILPKVQPFFSQIKNVAVIDCRAGVRVTTPNRLPLSQRVTKNCWVITGMGSRGLLYHAFKAQGLAKDLIECAGSSRCAGLFTG